MKKILLWYKRHYTFHTGLASFLFAWQLVHLYWLTTDVVFYKLFGLSLFKLTGLWQHLIVIVDYTEIPALVLTSFLYIHGLATKFTLKDILFLAMLNSQWLHLFWITDEFILEQFRGAKVILPIWVVWTAILIDYLELPVIYDTLKKFFVSLKRS